MPTLSTKDTAKSNRSTCEQDNEEDKAAEDKAFQALLNSQREILAQLDFDNSTSELTDLPYAEDAEYLPMVSPHASATEFHMSYSGDSDDSCYGYYRQQYPEYPHEAQQFFPGEHYYRESLRESQHSVGVGDDRFILDQITIGPRETRGPEIFDVDAEYKMRERKRATEQEFMEVVAQRKQKKRRRGSYCFSHNTGDSDAAAAVYDDLLPNPTDLDELDESTSSLLLDDLDFPSIHSYPEASLGLHADEEFKEDSDEDKKPRAKDDSMAVDEPKTTTPSQKEASKRSHRDIKKPRCQIVSDDSTSDMAISCADQKGMWKPRSKETPATTLGDSCVSLQLEDLATPCRGVSRSSSSQSQQRTLQVSILDGDLTTEDEETKAPSRTRADSSDTTGSQPITVATLSVALQQSLGSTKTIQDWDRKMGLKRSHSKTMRLSCRSREQLLTFLQQEQEEQQKPNITESADTRSDKEETAVVQVWF